VDKHNYAFSDFPFPDDADMYPHHSDIDKYCNDYVDHFGFRSCIQFNTEVVEVRKASDGGWLIKTATSGQPAGSSTLHARFVAVASGHHSEPNMVRFPGQETFPGRLFHSVHFKDPVREELTGKRVLVVGIGNSACDIAVEAHRVASKVVVSTRSGAWVYPPYLMGEATTLHANRAFLALPWRVGSFVVEALLSCVYGSPTQWGLNPQHRATASQPTVNATLLQLLQRRELEVWPNVARIDGETVVFADGSKSEFDVIIAATGYLVHVPYVR